MSNTAQQLPAGQEIWLKLVAIQQEYSQKIATAAATGDHAQVAVFVAEMNAKLMEAQSIVINQAHLTVVPTQTSVQEPPKSRYNQSQCEMNLDKVVYDGDRDMITGLMSDESFSKRVENLTGGAKWNARKHLLKSALKLSPTLAPKVWEVINKCKTAIGLKQELEVYVSPDQALNAYCWEPKDGKFLVSLTSGLLEKFDQDELAFVLGHELGHAIYLHSELPVRWLLDHPQADFAPLEAMKMFAWKRAAEISADRVGLICCQNFEAAGRAFFKLTSGVTDNSFKTNINEYMSQFDDLNAEMENDEVSPEDWYSTHPFSPLRLKALQIFNKSETYLELCNQKDKAELSEEQLEVSIRNLLEVMEPSYLTDKSDDAKSMSEFVYLGGMFVAKANGTIENSEVDALKGLFGHGIVPSFDFDPATIENTALAEKLTTLGKRINVTLSYSRKLNLIKDLTIIATADEEVDETEMECLYQICGMLNIKSGFVDDVLDQLTEKSE